MCLIIHAKPEFTISQDLMDDFSRRNDDGFGVMWIEDNKIHAKKFGPTEMDKLYETYLSLQSLEHFIHLRMRTHGSVDAEMAHPYYCGYGIWLMHNGILPHQGADHSKSDTWHFINDILTPLFKVTHNPHELIRSKVFSHVMHQYLGGTNRIVIADRGGYLLFNQKQWHTIDNNHTGCAGMLVSNTYAWNASAFGKTYYGNTHSSSSSGVTVLPARRRNHHNYVANQGELELETDEANKIDPSSTKEREFQERISSYLHCIGRNWYINRFGQILRRRQYGFDRRADLDDSEQFWATFNDQALFEAGVWMAEQNNLEPANLAAPSTNPAIPVVLPAGSANYVIKWEQFPEDMLTGIICGTEALHEKKKPSQPQQSSLH